MVYVMLIGFEIPNPHVFLWPCKVVLISFDWFASKPYVYSKIVYPLFLFSSLNNANFATLFLKLLHANKFYPTYFRKLYWQR